MREFSFFGSWEDNFAIAAAILGTGEATAFRDQIYDKPEPQLFDRLTPELQKIARERGGFYLWLPGVSYLPLDFHKFSPGMHAGKYWVSGGGPYLDLLLPGCREEGGTILLAAGSLSCDHRFYNPYTHVESAMPPAAQALHGEFVKIIKSYCKRFGPRKRWVGRDAIRLLEEGKARVNSYGFYE